MGNNYMDVKSKEKIAIIDANNFYASCERLFQPKWDKTPVAVLSNNDGCFIARSQEVKDMGIKMGQPVFQLEKEKKKDIKMFSSNYALYGDISDRIVNLLKRLVPRVEVYSIDESFLDLSHIPEEKILDEIKHIKSTIERLTGIPVSIGVAPNKTLAKLCNHISKTNKSFNGTCSYWNIDKSLIWDLDIDEVWGIGRQYKKRLAKTGVSKVNQFREMDPILVRNMLKVTGSRTWYELHDFLCYPLTTTFKKPKMITCSRSFGSSQWNPLQIKNAYWTFLKNCHQKLLKENLAVNSVTIFATTNRFDDNYYVYNQQIGLTDQTNNIDEIWNQIEPHISEMPIRLYYKCGLVFSKLRPNSIKQGKMFIESFSQADKPEVKSQLWMTRRDLLSGQFTTSWDDLPLAF